MNTRERFHAVMGYRTFDRLPVWFFGTWPETKQRWAAEGLAGARTQGGSGGPQLLEMDTDWEINPDGFGAIWDNQGILNRGPIAPGRDEVIEETDSVRIVRNRFGGLVKYPKGGSSVPQHLEPDLRPTRADWERFRTYFHEDCCFNTGPLISPAMHRAHYDVHYRRMIAAFRAQRVPFMLMDSDGKVDDLLPCWLDSGFDIVFPIEVGTWKANPVELRRRHGKRLRMMGGVDKHVIPRGEAAIRAELEPLRSLVEEGGFIPLPDHRIPPDCSLEQFRTYIRIFKELLA